MHWDTVNILLLVFAPIAVVGGLWIGIEGDNVSALFIGVVIGVACVGGTFIRTDDRATGIRDRQVKAELSAQGYQLNDISTSDHTATAMAGNCPVPVEIRKVDGHWKVFLNKTNGDRVTVSPAKLGLIATACG